MPERTKMLAANWKMNKTVAEAAQFVDALLPRIAGTQSDVVICPPYLALQAMVDSARGSAVQVYAQNMHEKDSGAYTGEVTAPVLEAIACLGVILQGFDKEAGNQVRVLYGGSVKAENAGEILGQPDVDGALVGGASLNADDFAAIVEAARG